MMDRVTKYMNVDDVGCWILIVGFIGIAFSFIGFFVLANDPIIIINDFKLYFMNKISSIRLKINNRGLQIWLKKMLITILLMSLILVLLGYIVIIEILNSW